MSWFLLALLPPALWSASNHIDKILLEKYFKGGGIGALMIFSSIIGVFISLLIVVFYPRVLSPVPENALLIGLNGFLYLLAIVPYFYALKKADASIVVALFQLIPVFTYILSWIFLKETLTTNQLLGGLLIVAGAIAISLELVDTPSSLEGLRSTSGKRIRFRKEIFFLMALSSVLFSLNFIFFKFFTVNADFWVTSFYEYLGLTAFAVILVIFVKNYRLEFIDVFKQNSLKVLGINSINEVIGIAAKLVFNYATLLVPVTLVSIVNGFQPLFVFLYGVILTVFFPQISKEEITKKHIIQKVISIIVIFIGAYLLNIRES